MKNTYAIVFEDYMNNKADQETVSLFVCSLLNELEETNGPEKMVLWLKIIQGYSFKKLDSRKNITSIWIFISESGLYSEIKSKRF